MVFRKIVIFLNRGEQEGIRRKKVLTVELGNSKHTVVFAISRVYRKIPLVKNDTTDGMTRRKVCENSGFVCK